MGRLGRVQLRLLPGARDVVPRAAHPPPRHAPGHPGRRALQRLRERDGALRPVGAQGGLRRGELVGVVELQPHLRRRDQIEGPGGPARGLRRGQALRRGALGALAVPRAGLRRGPGLRAQRVGAVEQLLRHGVRLPETPRPPKPARPRGPLQRYPPRSQAVPPQGRGLPARRVGAVGGVRPAVRRGPAGAPPRGGDRGRAGRQALRLGPR
mmetsp:Transcript_72705/g.213282  ORF Transcript_72705/g.213282 Transcript_72705/m.213282 type:complete len:210 (-) Transcript_72705:785-1414(-)